MSNTDSLAIARDFDWRFNTHGDPELKALFAAVGAYAGTLPRSGWLTLCGTPGCGKTHLARRIRALWNAHHAMVEVRVSDPRTGGTTPSRRHRAAGFYSWPKILSRCRGGENPLRDLGAEGLVVIDDIGAEYATDFARSKLVESLSDRADKPTVITTNLDLAQIENIDRRIASRLNRHGTVFQTKAGDYSLRPDRAPVARPRERPEPDDVDEFSPADIQEGWLREVSARVLKRFDEADG